MATTTRTKETFVVSDGPSSDNKYGRKTVYGLGVAVFVFLVLSITFIALYATAPAASSECGTTPSGTTPNGTTPSGTTPSGTTLNGTTPSDVPTTTPLPVKPGECGTAGCRRAAESLQKSINKDVQPCDNFYEFACGNWNKTEPMPDDRSTWGVFNVLRRELASNLKDLLNVTHGDTTSLNSTQKMQQYFQTCVDEEKLEDQANIETLRNHIIAVFPETVNFPFNDSPIPDFDASFRAMAKARKFGLRLGVFNNFIQSDNDQPRVNIIHLDAAPLGMERHFYLREDNSTEVTAYREYLRDMKVLFARKFGLTGITEAMALESANRFIEFETVLAQAKLTPEERRDPRKTQNKMTIGHFAGNYTDRMGLNASELVGYFTTAWDSDRVRARLNASEVINVRETNYYDVLTDLLRNYTNNPEGHRFLANYLIFQLANSYSGRLGAEFRNISRKFSTVLQGPSSPIPRWETCVNQVNNEFPNAVGRLYVESHFQKTAKVRLEKMVKYLFDSIRTIIIKSDWMTPTTRINALQKADLFTVLAGYEDYIVDDSDRLNREHAEFAVSEDSYVANAISYGSWSTNLEGEEFVNGTRRDTWITGAAVVNAFFAPNFASISFPAGILQPPFLGDDYPDYWNYGAVGTVIGHEITHGFDDKGSQYDGYGVLTNWWDDESRLNFTSRAKGLIDQYSNFSMMGVQMNGNLTQGENIADNGGIKEAFMGYQNYIQREHAGVPEPKLPGLDYTPEQLFFLANAQVWCSDFRQQALENQVRTGAHSPGRFRVIGPMQNYDEFSKAFTCPAGSFMNPEVKFGVW
ncbi:neprilysin-4-like [Paramacrobiotus metropolitanus]|uniref:neprilysin-4-like n=1 Tax=Paramacrobiotus metropolitanus TaxID=2943436 RepID=UPI002445B33D|nr:neprilysin-4-like [Paramacrobiotus metropolitanus]